MKKDFAFVSAVELLQRYLLNKRAAFIKKSAEVENATFCHIAAVEVEAIDKTLGIKDGVDPDADNTPEKR